MMYKRIKELRKKNNLTQKEVAEKLEVSLTSYSLYESGKRTIPLPVFIKLAKLYNTSIDYIVGDTYKKVPHPRLEKEPENNVDNEE